MKGIAIKTGTTDLHLVDRPEPSITSPDEIKLRVLQVGICGTDREEVSGGRAQAPDGQGDLVIGHEMFGQVVEVGDKVTRVKPDDYAVFTVRRGCGECLPCSMNRSDMCRTGKYHERGIWGMDGYQTAYVTDKEQYIVRVPPELAPVAVLAEPLSIVEKGIDEAVKLQTARAPEASAIPNWLFGRRCLVAGLGPVGLLGAMVLRLRGCEVFGLDIVDADSARPKWLKKIGGQYVDGREVPAKKLDDAFGPMDLIFEATGIAKVEFNLLDALALNGVYVLTGVPGGDSSIKIPGAALVRQLVLGNQVIVGSVNAARGHFQMGIDDLAHASLRWGDHLKKLITHKHRWEEFEQPLKHHLPDEIKEVIEWASP
jgi:threonine dehydrogenase-like Zn-dependent dehydrogenase